MSSWMKTIAVIVAVAQSGRVEAKCDPMGCGVNGVWIGRNLAFHELDAGTHLNFSDTERNSDGVRIIAFETHDGTPLQLRVEGDELVGIPLSVAGSSVAGSSVAPLRGTALEKARIQLDAGCESYTMEILKYQCFDYWPDTPAGANVGKVYNPTSNTCTGANAVPVYTIEYTRDGSNDKVAALCGPRIDPNVDTSIDGRVVIFRGDRYKYDRRAPTQLITETGPTDRWFNVACGGTAIAKLHLNRHTLAAQDTSHTTTVAQRKALLRMLTGDYCGNGKLITKDGHPIRYKFHQPWTFLNPQYSLTNIHSVDAVWNENGASCVGIPRMADTYTRAKLVDEFTKACGSHKPPFCEDKPAKLLQPAPFVTAWDTDTAPEHYLISANPKPFQLKTGASTLIWP